MNKVVSKDPEYWNECLFYMKYLLRHKTGWIILAIDDEIRMESGIPGYYEYAGDGGFVSRMTPGGIVGHVVNGQICCDGVGKFKRKYTSDIPNISECHYILLVGYKIYQSISNEYPVTPENAIRIIQSMPEREAFQGFWICDLRFLYCSI